MTSHAVLDNITHQSLKVDSTLSDDYGDNVASICIYLTELSDIQAEYPVLFQKDSNTGAFSMCAMLGFKNNENLFLDTEKPCGWAGNYIPALLQRGPFLIGYQDQRAEGGGDHEPVIHINATSPRIQKDRGEPLFLELGGHSTYLNKITNSLKIINDGFKVTEAMVKYFDKLELIQPLNLDIVFNNNEQHIINGYFTLDAEKLASLTSESLFELNNKGFLAAAFQIVTSMRNIKALISRKNSLI